MIPTKDQILERLDTRFQTKPDDTWNSLSQFLLDLPRLKVTTPVVIPEKELQSIPLNLTKTPGNRACVHVI